MRLPDPSPVLDKNLAPMGPEILSSTGAGVWRKAPMAFPDPSSVLDKFQSAKFLVLDYLSYLIPLSGLWGNLPVMQEAILLHGTQHWIKIVYPSVQEFYPGLGAAVWRKAPSAFPASNSVLDKCLSARLHPELKTSYHSPWNFYKLIPLPSFFFVVCFVTFTGIRCGTDFFCNSHALLGESRGYCTKTKQEWPDSGSTLENIFVISTKLIPRRIFFVL